jgi:hypothetical protein
MIDNQTLKALHDKMVHTAEEAVARRSCIDLTTASVQSREMISKKAELDIAIIQSSILSNAGLTSLADLSPYAIRIVYLKTILELGG